MKNKKFDLHAFLIYLFLVFVVLFIAGYVILAVFDVFDKFHGLDVLFAILCPTILVVFFSLYIFYRSDKKTKDSIRLENEYNLGSYETFYNSYLLQRRIRKLSRFNKKKDAYLIAFTGTKQAVSRNMSRNNTITHFNGYIARFLVSYFENEENQEIKCAYCFYHGFFLVYLIKPEAEVRKIIDDIDNALYKIAMDHNLRLHVQPFFGFTKVDYSKSDVVLFDEAIQARNISEQKFDTVTIYKADENKGSYLQSEVNAIKDGLDNNEFVVYYQPKFNLTTKTFTSSEALVRWNSKNGLLTPARFIETATLSGLIHEIDIYVFKKVCEELSNTIKKARRVIPVSVNFSMYEFYRPDFVNDIISTIKHYGIPTSDIEIEITETTSQANTFMAISKIKQLRDQGLKIVMDDFGIGYSNLDNLLRIPFDTIKIDKSFIDGILDNDNKSKEIIKFLVTLCRANGMEVVAEGVDSKEQVDFLTKVKCDTIQGYYYSKPLPKDAYDKFLKNNNFEKKEENAK